MTTLVRGFNPKWFMNNLFGQTLDDTYYLFILSNEIPYNPVTVFEDPAGAIPWSFPIQCQPSGGFPDNIYFNPSLTYRIQVRQGPDEILSPLIWDFQNVQFGEGGSIIDDPMIVAENMITNPQFADVYFNGSMTYTQASSATYIVPIGPGWQLVLVGAGTSVITQNAISGNNDIIGNPSYSLTINNSGWTNAYLQQVFSNNGAIFGGGAVSAYFLAFATGSSQAVSLNYQPSNGTGSFITNILSAVVTTGPFEPYSNAVDIPVSTNPDNDGSALVTLSLTIPNAGTVTVTNFMFVGQSTPRSAQFIANPFFPPYAEQTYQRTVDQEFNVYQNATVHQGKNSILTGWNFGNNPWQFTTTAITNVTVNKYTADQTIVLQQNYIAANVQNNVAVGVASAANNYGFQVNAVNGANQFGILQYIAPLTTAQLWGNNLAAMVRAFIVTQHTSTVRFKMRLIYIDNVPNTLSRTDPIASWTLSGDPVAAAGYTLIVPPNDPIYTLTTSPKNFAFNLIPLPAMISNTRTLGIIIYTIDNMNSASVADSIIFNDVSLVQNDFALLTQPETFDETLRKCQFYYEKSFDWSFVPGSGASAVSHLSFGQQAETNGGSTFFYPSAFTISYKTQKNQTPVIKFYAPVSGTAGSGSATVNANGTSQVADYSVSANFNNSIGGLNNATYTAKVGANAGPNIASTTLPLAAFFEVQFTANSCLGNPTLP